MINVNNQLARELQSFRNQGKTEETPDPIQPVSSAYADEDLNNSNKIDWEALKPFPKIPNCREFRIELGGIDKVFSFFKINKKIPPKLIFKGYSNSKFINYYVRQINRLKNEQDPEKY